MHRTAEIPPDRFKRRKMVSLLKFSVAIMSAALLLLSCGKNYSGRQQPLAKNGILDLSRWDFRIDGPVRLDGQWEIFWNSFIEPGLQNPGSPAGYINVPSQWNDMKIGTQLLPLSGFATYRLIIIFPDNSNESVSLRIPAVDTSFRLFAKGEKLFQNGIVGSAADASKPLYYAPVQRGIHTEKKTELLLHLSNFHYPRPGLRDSILLGDTDTITSRFEQLLVIDIFLIGAILLMAMYHAGVYYLRRLDNSSIYFALFCLCTAGRLAVTGEGYAYRLPWFTWEMGTAFEYILYYGCVVTCGLYMRSLYPKEITRTIMRIIVTISAVFTLFVISTPIMIYARTLIAFNLFVAVMILYFLYSLVLAVLRKREASVIFLIGSTILFVAVINDLLYNYRIVHTAYIMPYGLYSFFFVQSFLLAKKFSGAFSKVEELKHGLESKVIERTAAVEHSLSLLEAAIESTADGLLVINTEGKISIYNKKFLQLWNIPEHIINMNSDEALIEFVAGQLGNPDEFMSKVRELYSTPGRESFDELLFKDGRVFERISFPQKQSGRIIGRVWSFRDISVRKHMEAAMSESEERFRHLVQNANDIIYRVDEKGIFTYINPAAQRISGFREEEMIGRHYSDFLLPEYRDDAAKFFETQFMKRLPATYSEYPHITKDGKTLWLGQNVQLIMEGDRITGFQAIARDITERKRMEAALRSAKEEADTANRAKSEFLANMSHEIRTPMNPIIGLAHLLLQTDLTEKQRDYVGKIEDSAQLLLGIINDILDFSKIEARKMEIEEVDFKLDTVLQNIANMFVRAAEFKGIELHFRIDPGVPAALRGDSLRLQQVLINLTSNAVKFTEKGDIILGVTCTAGDDDRGTVLLEFSVADSGIGLTGEQQKNLFQSFTQADTSITRRFGGTGLGLAISRSLVELLGGEIGVSSEPGKGSRFYFTLPMKSRAPQKTEIETSSLKGKKALIVDNNPVSLNIVESYCKMLQIETAAASSEDEASVMLERGSTGSLDYIIIDWKMLGPDDMDTIRRLRQQPGVRSSTSIITMSAYRLDEIALNRRGPVISGFLTKPVYLSSLAEALMGSNTGEKQKGPKQAAGSDQSLMAPFTGMKVLLVEDNVINQQVAMEILKYGGLAVVAAGNGREAIAILEEQDFDLVLMDVQMPEIDGLEATRIIRRNKRWAKLPIIAMTAHALEGDRELCLQAGMNDHTSKPIDPASLFQTLAQWLKPIPLDGNRVPDSAADSDGQLPPEMPGIDVQRGVNRLAGNRSLFKKIVIEFCKTFAGAAQELERHIQAGDIQAAKSLVHSIKGTAGSISATALHAAVIELEQALKSDGLELPEGLLEKLRTELNTVLTNLDILGSEETVTAGAGTDMAAMRTLMEKLHHEIKESSFNSVDTMNELLRVSGSYLHEELLGLKDHVYSFEFKKAGDAIEVLLKKMKS